MKDKLPKASRIPDVNIGAGSGDMWNGSKDPSWIPNGDGITSTDTV